MKRMKRNPFRAFLVLVMHPWFCQGGLLHASTGIVGIGMDATAPTPGNRQEVRAISRMQDLQPARLSALPVLGEFLKALEGAPGDCMTIVDVVAPKMT